MSISKTPAPKKERIFGSKVNKPKSAESSTSASKIRFSKKTIESIKSIIDEHNLAYPDKSISLDIAKAVVRRGMGAYSVTHRPTISGGAKNSRVAWGLARLKAFVYKVQKGKSKSGKYNQDDDLIRDMRKKYHLGGDMSKHLAPNGKPSNLTHEQWHLVRTPEFKAWFGDWENDPENASKVVDQNGEPLVVFHGTSKDFNIFEKEKIGKQTKAPLSYLGFFFTDNKNVAKGFTKTKFFGNKERKGAKVLDFFLNIRNIKRFTIYETIQKFNKIEKTILLKNDMLQSGIDGIVIDKAEEDWEIRLKEFDGQQFIAFEPNQIKLADGTNTTFDSNNPDIRFEDGGEIKYKLDIYQVSLNIEDDIEIIYEGSDKNKAYNKYENFDSKTDIETQYQDRNDIFLMLDKKVNTYEFVYNLDEYETIEDYPLEDYFEEDYYWKLIDEGDWENLETKDILAINKLSDELLKKVEEYYKNKFGKYKYNTIRVEDSEENYKGCIQLRVANHSENVGNIDKFGNCNYYISIVIADYDATKEKFQKGRKSNEIELYFDTDAEIEEIINEVDSQIEEFREKILNEYEQGGEIKHNNWGLNNLIYWWK